MNDLEKWNIVLKFYKDTWGYPEKVVDYLACREIVGSHCKGKSIETIANRTFVKEKYVRIVLKEFIGFSGWEIDLDFSPLAVYNIVKQDKKAFMSYIDNNIDMTYTNFVKELSYSSCKKFMKLEEILNGYN